MTKRFYGGIFIDRDKLSEQGIDYPIKIEYYKICDNTENKDITQYGIEVVKTEYKKDDIRIENKEVERITKEENVINKILEKLKMNQVTPVTTKYIVEDMIYNQGEIDKKHCPIV